MPGVIPEVIKSNVVFLFAETQPGRTSERGTGFFISIFASDNYHRFLYLVTAKHVVTRQDGTYFDQISVRINKKAGGSDSFHVKLTGEDANPSFIHGDMSVDLVVIPLLIDAEIYEIQAMTFNMILGRPEEQDPYISEGDEVFYVGLFLPYSGENRNYPIVRFGRAAMIPGEKIPWNRQMTDLFLIESQSFGGNSGSPVFLFIGEQRHMIPVTGQASVDGGTPGQIFLAGVLKGSFGEYQDSPSGQDAVSAKLPQNLGITAVVPAFRLRDIFLSGPVREFQAQCEA